MSERQPVPPPDDGNRVEASVGEWRIIQDPEWEPGACLFLVQCWSRCPHQWETYEACDTLPEAVKAMKEWSQSTKGEDA